MTPVRVDDELLRAWPLPQPARDDDKEGRGRVLVIAGSQEVPGAAVLAGVAALRAGAGKLAVATPQSAWAVVAAALPEARVIALPETPDGAASDGAIELLKPLARKTAAVLVGPGMMGREGTLRLVRQLIESFPKAAMVLDALALDAAMELKGFERPVVLTPHAGEMAHLTGIDKDQVQQEAPALAQRYAREWNVVLALKGADTFVATADELWHHEGGTAGLATSGSGDVLAGIVAGLAARGATLPQAVVWGVALHSRAGRALARRLGPVGFLARELPGEVPGLLSC